VRECRGQGRSAQAALTARAGLGTFGREVTAGAAGKPLAGFARAGRRSLRDAGSRDVQDRIVARPRAPLATKSASRFHSPVRANAHRSPACARPDVSLAEGGVSSDRSFATRRLVWTLGSSLRIVRSRNPRPRQCAKFRALL
jgi:hypothetical protein